jgi:esterase/lipase superfamily enzyme
MWGWIAALALATSLAGCADYDNAYFVHSVWRGAGSTNVDVFFVTDRNIDRNMPGGFGYQPGRMASCGVMPMAVPPARLPGGTALFAKETGRVTEACGTGEESLAAAIATAARQNHCGAVLIYVHGFDTGFETAALRAGQLAADTQWSCTVASFSWSSSGHKDTYYEDVSRSRAAEPLFADFLCALARSGIRADIIAHSIGARLVLKSLASTRGDCIPVADQLIFAAPDIAATPGHDDFAAAYHAAGTRFRHLTIYASQDDVALAISQRMNGGLPRLGNDPAFARADGGSNVDVIDARDAPGDIWGHNYFNFSYEMLSDMSLALAGVPAEARFAPQLGREATLWRDGDLYRLKVEWTRAPDFLTRLLRWLITASAD